ncbi:bifunctional riboflavin kinase/FAD synthetase [Rasiella rasia]|uniref:Riboflavin biosynthesis protein n=1 Tax=Rasiella rasia TaxID=2744027 RepID=A0A6G6GPT9_9FLAO|nr:bifunctional riboflavin kinase/FAD synthetase [Rasiella rasia]QIE59731.1 bifunctional riboflavin kinase/FAD synthetase [Rasiella rasia]
MQEHRPASAYTNKTPSVITIGTFDGVHIGHKAILKKLVASAKKDNLDSVLLTFFPHPRMVLQKEASIQMLNTLSEKKALLEQTGLDHLIIHPFTHQFSRLTAVEYVRDILVNKLHAKKIIIGYDHRFGRNRTATISDLKEFGETYGFEVEEISVQELDDVAVSSTKIRNALKEGDVETANNYLGYSYMITGTVVKGKGIGATWNYPTANLQPSDTYKLIPKNGVYITQAKIEADLKYGITSIGTNPTVGGKSRTIETFFLDTDANLYDKPLQLEFLKFIREEETFENVEALKSAIQQDEKVARAYVRTHE